MSSLRALVVGGTSGVGNGIAKRLATATPSYAVTIVGRTKPAAMPATMDFRGLEATSMSEIKRLTDSIRETSQKYDYLVMTQGIMSTAPRTETPEGIDRKMALHYYGKQLLIRELLPVLNDNAKVVVVYDGKYGNMQTLDWDDLDLKKGYTLGKAANHSMAMNDGMIQYWAREQKQRRESLAKSLHFFHAWPGGVNTGLSRELPWYLKPLMLGAGAFLTSPEKCAEFLVAGFEARAAEDTEGKGWSNIGRKGEVVEGKPVWTDGQLDKVAEHTWSLIDEALRTTESSSATSS